MKLDEMKLWLEGNEAAQVNWRIDKENLSQVSQMITEYSQTPGGRAASLVWSKIQREKEIAQQIIEERERGLEERKALVAAVKADYLANGGSEKTFNERLSEIIDAYAISGRTREVLDKVEAYHRSQAARTF